MPRQTLEELAKIQDGNPNEIDGYVSGDPSFKWSDVRRCFTKSVFVEKRQYQSIEFTRRCTDGRHKCDRCHEPIRKGATIVLHDWRQLDDGNPKRDISHVRCWTTAELAIHRGSQPFGGVTTRADPAIGTKAWYRSMSKALACSRFKVDAKPVTRTDVMCITQIAEKATGARKTQLIRDLEARQWLAQQLELMK